MTKLRITIISFLAIALSVPAIAQKSLLWRISGNGLAKPSYLFGQIDYICPASYLWTKAMQDCFDKSDEICTEVNLSDPAVLKQISQGMMDRSGKKLEDYFSEAEYIKVSRYAKDTFHLNLANIQMLKPVGLQPFIIKQLLGCSDAVAYNKRILDEAQKSGKATAGLDDATNVANDIATTHFNEKVATVLAELADGSRYYYDYRSAVMTAYKQQDIQQVNKVFLTAKGFSTDDFKLFLAAKSQRWVSHMHAMMQQSSVFFSLNVINLGGEDGVISLLKKAGYTVEAVY